MEAVKEWWTTSRGNKLFAWHLLPVSQPKAVVLLVHGHGEHSWRYLHWAKQFAYCGYAFYSWDHIGHGMSDGQPGHVRRYEHLLFEVDLAITKVREQFPDLPIILYGHSMGGNIAINYAIRRSPSIKLLIVTSPWIRLAQPNSPYVDMFLRVMSFVLPFYPYRSPVRPEAICHPEVEVRKYAEDPLIHNRILPRLYTSIKDAGEYALRNSKRIKIPTLFMHGSADSITSVIASRAVADSMPDATYIEWPGLFHELHNEAQRDDVFGRIKEWIDKHLD
ncbi:MAG: lysophospholipase [Bacteroidales bacterium]|nr:lysophospholipase [Bacteroidales bacterium]